MSDPISSGNRAKAILDCDEWRAAWDAYRQRIFEEIEAADSRDGEKVLHLKRLLAAAKSAKAHLERLVTDGTIATAEMKLDEDRKRPHLFSWNR
jgi:hypothetical protein